MALPRPTLRLIMHAFLRVIQSKGQSRNITFKWFLGIPKLWGF